jgi:hypothetical protein
MSECSINVFLNDAQMDHETVQFDFEWARNLEQPYDGFDFGDSRLTFDDSGSVGTLSNFALKVS